MNKNWTDEELAILRDCLVRLASRSKYTMVMSARTKMPYRSWNSIRKRIDKLEAEIKAKEETEHRKLSKSRKSKS